MKRVRAAVLAGFAALALVGAHAGAQEHAEGEHEHAAASEGGEHAHHPEAPNWTDFGCGRSVRAGEPRLPPPVLANVINFLLLLAILGFAVRRAINPALKDRRSAIESEMNEAQRLRAEAAALHKSYTEKLANLENEIAALREEFGAAGDAEYKRILAQAETRAERLQQEAEATLANEVKQLRDDLIREAVDAAVASAEHAVTKAANEQDQDRLADAFITHVGKTPGASA